MVRAFDRIVIAVSQLDGAVADYRALLGCSPLPGLPGSPGCCFDLGNTLVELAPLGEPEGIRGLVFESAGAPVDPIALDNPRGLDLWLADGSSAATLRAAGDRSALQVDHLVLRTADAPGCIALLARELGLRLALDQTVPEWGGRMLFFRAGKLTLEVIEPGRDAPARDSFWGIAYRCEDIERSARQLTQRGINLSAIRPGRKAGTRVMTVKSHCLGIPTLFIEHPT